MTLPASGHRPFSPRPVDRLTRRVMTAAGMLPPSVARLLAGRAHRVDGQRLDPHFQLGLRAMGALSGGGLRDLGVERNRQDMERQAFAISGTPVPLPRVQELSVPVDGADLPARLYSPVDDDRRLPLLVYYHGGGWVLGSIDTHDATCRHLCHTGQLRVLSVGYRLAPEHRFPTAVDDACAASAWAHAEADDLHVDQRRIAVGGDSAGANLAAVVCQQAALTGDPMPAFQLLIVPGVDMTGRRRSFELFGQGYFLTAEDVDYYEKTYLLDEADRTDVRASPLLATDLSGLPPAYVAVAGFDPLRDEGEDYARRLAEAGVPVSLRRHESVVHPFINAVGASPLARQALAEAVGALRMGLRH